MHVETIKKTALKNTNIPRRMVDRQKANKKIKACCRDEANLMVEGRKTSENRPHTDMLMFTCTKCNCRHFVAGLDAGAGVGQV